jgi:hypothetical protein
MPHTSPANALTKQIIDFIYDAGGYAFRVNTVGIFDSRKQTYRTAAKKGVSDVLACHQGRFIAVEVKIGKDHLSDEQAGFLASISHYGGLAFVAKDFESFKHWWQTCNSSQLSTSIAIDI